MTDKQRYERAMRQDYPNDFISDSEWDFIESMASAGYKNSKQTTTACRMPKSGGGSKMARYTQEQRAAYGAGVAYGAAKAGKRVPVKDENKASFRAGVAAGKKQSCACKSKSKRKK